MLQLELLLTLRLLFIKAGRKLLSLGALTELERLMRWASDWICEAWRCKVEVLALIVELPLDC